MAIKNMRSIFTVRYVYRHTRVMKIMTNIKHFKGLLKKPCMPGRNIDNIYIYIIFNPATFFSVCVGLRCSCFALLRETCIFPYRRRPNIEIHERRQGPPDEQVLHGPRLCSWCRETSQWRRFWWKSWTIHPCQRQALPVSHRRCIVASYVFSYWLWLNNTISCFLPNEWCPCLFSLRI